MGLQWGSLRDFGLSEYTDTNEVYTVVQSDRDPKREVATEV